MKNQQSQKYQKNHQKLIDEESESVSNQFLGNQFNYQDFFKLFGLQPDIAIDQEKSKLQHEIIIENTPVIFPHQPYSVQIEYMRNLIHALDQKQNALLESPTGTGKTLSTLCASLAWLKKYRLEKTKEDMPKNIKLIYASRTHSQLKQVARELKKTFFQPNVAQLGSRDQYCMRGDLSQIKGTRLNQICKKEIRYKRCLFHQKEELMKLAFQNSKLLNSLEEAKQFGYKNKCCPYYFERERMEFADLIMMPYNYLLEKDILEYVKIDNSIIIFDEAHNVQRTAEEGSSFSITQNYVEEAVKELERWIDECENKSPLKDALNSKLELADGGFKLTKYRQIMATIKAFAKYMELCKNILGIPPQKEDNFQIHQAREIFQMVFENTGEKEKEVKSDSKKTYYENGITSENISNYLKDCSILIEIVVEHSQYQGQNFETWTRFIRNIYDLLEDEKEIQEQEKSVESLENPINQYKLAFQVDQSNQLSLHMWCLDPSLAFKRLFKKDIYSIILTSGTLAPFESWACELRVDFPICLQNKHFINISQNLRVFQHKSLDFSFNQRNNEDQINTLGMSLLSLCRVIPNGILVIFSSYSLMNKLRGKWRNSEILLRIQEIKACLWEPNQTEEMQNVFEMYRQKANKGAIMFAVQRGKVAEGIDFSDELCRAVFLIGVPYPPKQDQKLMQKMGYLDQLYVDPEFNNQKRLKSSEWYTQQAIRATNQALGRVIRHVNDYGIVFFCDKRFQYGDISRGLSEWVKPAIEPWLNDDEVIKKTKDFFKRDAINLQQPIEFGQEIKTKNKDIQQKASQLQNHSLTNEQERPQIKIEIKELENTINQQQQYMQAFQTSQIQQKQIGDYKNQDYPIFQKKKLQLKLTKNNEKINQQTEAKEIGLNLDISQPLKNELQSEITKKKLKIILKNKK